MKKIEFTTVLIIVLIVLLLGLIFDNINQRAKARDLETVNVLYENAQLELNTIKNKYDQEVTKVEVLMAERNKLFVDLNVKDVNLNKLQQIIKTYEKKNGDLNTALIISNETIIHLQDSLNATIVGYSKPTNDSIVYPIYNRTFNNKWESGSVTLGIDKFDLKLKNINEYDVTIGNEKISMFKKQPFAIITNLNPNLGGQLSVPIPFSILHFLTPACCLSALVISSSIIYFINIPIINPVILQITLVVISQ